MANSQLQPEAEAWPSAARINRAWHAGETAFADRVASGATQLAESGAFLWGFYAQEL
jgi:hypothetical protein